MTGRSSSRRTMSDRRGTMSDWHDRTAGPVEAMMTADGLLLAAHGLGRMRRQKHTGAARRWPSLKRFAAFDRGPGPA
jgi:hypothetical protein